MIKIEKTKTYVSKNGKKSFEFLKFLLQNLAFSSSSFHGVADSVSFNSELI